MIRINLLSEGRRPVVARKTRPKIDIGDQDPSIFFLGGGLLLAVLIAVGWYLLLDRQISAKDAEIRIAGREVDELRPILKEVNDFKTKQRELERKIKVINDLTLKQRGPVQIMDRVSRALPDSVWIRSMNFRGQMVDLVGTAFTTNAIASFIEALDKVPEFAEPETKDVARDRGGGSYSYRISFWFTQQAQQMPKEIPAAPAPEAEAEAAP